MLPCQWLPGSRTGSDTLVPTTTLTFLDQDLAYVAAIRECAYPHLPIIRLSPFQLARKWPEHHKLSHALCGPLTGSRSAFCAVEIGNSNRNTRNFDGICISHMRDTP